jgi:hypothetical protein
MECVWVGNVVNQHNHVCLAQKLKSDLFEDVLSGYINQMKLYSLIRFALNGYFLDIVLATLSHHIVVIEGLFADLIDKACLSHGWLTRYDHSCTQYRHILIYYFEFK